MKKLNFLPIFLILFTVQFLSVVCEAQIKLENLLCENLTNPLGLDVTQPRFSWQIISQSRNVMQTAYEIRVNESESYSEKAETLRWSSGKVISDSSVQVVYKGPLLRSDTRYYWQVRIWDNKGEESKWSEPAFWQMGLLDTSDWKAEWIKQSFGEDSSRSSPMFRKLFSINKKIKSATAYVTCLGLYTAFLNGRRIGDAYFTPGWTDYNNRLQYQAYDVTNLLNEGQNAIGVVLGDGWYKRFYLGKDPKLSILFQINIHYNDGTTDFILSNGSWKCSTGMVRTSEIFDGGVFDARKEEKGWTIPAYDDNKWSNAVIKNSINVKLIATCTEPITEHEKFKPVKLITTPKGEHVIDFGQMLAGLVRFKVRGKAGDTVKIFHADVLDKAGNFYTANLWGEKEDIYILNGEGEESFEPEFTYQGFRYIKVEGYPGELKPENFTAVALYTDMKETGDFSCSDSLVNRLQQNIKWTVKANFFGIPTATCDRDERLGWDDTQIMSRISAFNMRVNNLYANWLKDLSADQLPDGMVPLLFPNVAGPVGGIAGWGDVATIVPWNMYLIYGDKRILDSQYPSMKAWVKWIQGKTKDFIWNIGFPWWTYGDWLYYMGADPSWTAWGPPAPTDLYLIAQCFYAHSIQLLINAGEVLGKSEDVASYSVLLQNVKQAFVKEYVTPSGSIVSGTQTAYVLALQFDMLPDTLRKQAAIKLVDNITDYQDHFSTGELGSQYLCFVLSRFGYADTAYKLLLQKSYPSWLYPVTMGATSIWERWDTIKPDSTFSNPVMNSFDIPQLGSIGDWLYREVAGIDTYEDGPGYKHIRIKPYIANGLTSAQGTLQTYYGEVSSHWEMESRELIFYVTIPVNTKATVYVPGEDVSSVYENGEKVSTGKEIQLAGTEDGYVVLNLGSGSYHFTVTR
jgi:alpha-L-rhamnosidase